MADHLGRHVEHGVAPVLAGETHDHLAGLHDLAGLGPDLGHHALGIGVQLGEAHLVLGEAKLRLDRRDLGACRLARLPGPFVDRTRREAALLELALALILVLGLARLPLGRGQVGFRRTERVLLVLRIEPADQLSGLDPVADIDAALDHAPAQAEGEPRLVLGLDPAGEHHRHACGALLDGHGADGADLGLCFLLGLHHRRPATAPSPATARNAARGHAGRRIVMGATDTANISSQSSSLADVALHRRKVM